MAWTSLNEEASGYYQCLSVHQAGTGVSHPNGQVYRAGVQQRHYRGWNQIIRWLLRPLPGDMSDFWLLTARELSVLKILMQGMSFSEIARYEQRSSKTLHAIATRALMKLGLGTLSDFRLLYTGCGDSRVKRNIRLHAKYIGQHSAHRLTQYVQNMVSGILYPEKVAVGESINSDAISGKVLSGQRKNISKKRPGLLWHSSVVTTTHCGAYGLATV